MCNQLKLIYCYCCLSNNSQHLHYYVFGLKIHQNNQFLLFVDVSVSIRDLHQNKKLVLVPPFLGTKRT